MKTKYFLIIFSVVGLFSCASPEDRSNKQIDTNSTMVEDTAGIDTITTMNGRSGDNGTGTDTTNTSEEKARRASGKK